MKKNVDVVAGGNIRIFAKGRTLSTIFTVRSQQGYIILDRTSSIVSEAGN